MTIPYLSISDDELFPIVNGALPAWILLAFLPRWRYTMTIATAISLFYAVLYVLLMADTLYFHPIEAGFDDFSSLDGLLKLFSFKQAVFGGWVHYICFDLWTGIWITRDANTVGFPQLLLFPILFFTMMLGPTGLLMYFGLRGLFGYHAKIA